MRVDLELQTEQMSVGLRRFIPGSYHKSFGKGTGCPELDLFAQERHTLHQIPHLLGEIGAIPFWTRAG